MFVNIHHVNYQYIFVYYSLKPIIIFIVLTKQITILISRFLMIVFCYCSLVQLTISALGNLNTQNAITFSLFTF